MSQSDLIQAEMRRLGVSKEDETQRLLVSLQTSVHTIETTLKKKIEDLEEVVRTLQGKLKEPITLEINREERERIERIEEKLDRVDHTAQRAAHMYSGNHWPIPKIAWKTAPDISFTLIKEAPVVLSTGMTPVVCPTETAPPHNTVSSVKRIPSRKLIFTPSFTAPTAPKTVIPIGTCKLPNNEPHPRVLPVLVEKSPPVYTPCGGQKLPN